MNRGTPVWGAYDTQWAASGKSVQKPCRAVWNYEFLMLNNEPLRGTVLNRFLPDKSGLGMTKFWVIRLRSSSYAGTCGRRTAVRTAGVRDCFTFLCSIVKDQLIPLGISNPSFRGVLYHKFAICQTINNFNRGLTRITRIMGFLDGNNGTYGIYNSRLLGKLGVVWS